MANRHGTAFFNGTATIPIGRQYGLEATGLAGTAGPHSLAGSSVELFWRDPSYAALGFYGSYLHDATSTKSQAIGRGGVSGAAYFDRVSIEGLVGWEGGSLGGHVFDVANLSVYPDDNLRLSVGQRYFGGRNWGAAGAEYQLSLFHDVGTSLFVEGRYP